MSPDGRAVATRKVVVVGLGYVGLPVAVAAARAGHRCVGFDLDRRVIEGLSSGRSHVPDIGDDELLTGDLSFTADADTLSDADVVVVCVPTPLTDDGRPDLRAVDAAMTSVSERLPSGGLVVLESTTYPGTTEGPVLDALGELGEVGVDFHLAFSPERIDPGNPDYRFENIPKLVGGVTEECSRQAADFYRTMVDDVVVLSGTREAEMAKLLENTYRHVNIALMNEMAIFCHELGIDLWEAIRGASTKPFGFAPFRPGPGVGGHCIPIDPNYLSHTVRSLGYQFRFVELAQEVSQRMPAYVVARVQSVLNEDSIALRGARVAVLGLAYKAGQADTRETPARRVIERLAREGAHIVVHDPLVEAIDVGDVVHRSAIDLADALDGCDVAVVLQPNDSYLAPGALDAAPRVFDATGRVEGPNVERL